MPSSFKENYILLSKIAKEKKFAQEYLGLLARRGDLGSIRIGKRWYSTREWFGEFEKDALAKKEEIKIAEEIIQAANIMPALKMPVAQPVEIKKIQITTAITAPTPQSAESISLPIVLSSISAAPVAEKKINNISARVEKPDQPSRIVRRLPTINLKGKINTVKRRVNFSGAAREENQLISEQKIAFEKPSLSAIEKFVPLEKSDTFSPIFSAVETQKMPFLPRFAFVASMVLLFFLIFQAGYVWRNDILKLAGIKSGEVAGANDTKSGFSELKTVSENFLEDKGDEVRAKISLSRIVLLAALEKEKNKENVETK